MVSAAIIKHKIDAIVVGADRVANNGDTANKIGTLQLGFIIIPSFNIKHQIVNDMWEAGILVPEVSCKRQFSQIQVPLITKKTFLAQLEHFVMNC